ncbi:MAG TPA: transposase [Tepidisphaeraceae bacterium]|jgi:REP element-mobilizing transposase RayT|nr:transposase [Tepidisphaeraceae bacterium]
MPPVAAYHVIITAYGFWLPNDPRGSWSDFVRSWEIFQHGPATKTTQRRSLARDHHNIPRRLAAKRALAHSPVHFTGPQARALARGFAICVNRTHCPIHAASIMPTHAHLILGRQSYPVEQTINLLKGAATAQLTRETLHPFQNTPYKNGTLHTPWARGHWKVFLTTPNDITRAIQYVENNPLKDGFAPQSWSFIHHHHA